MISAILIVGTPITIEALCQGFPADSLSYQTATTTQAAQEIIQQQTLAGMVLDMAAPDLNPFILCAEAAQKSIPVAASHVNHVWSRQAVGALGINYVMDPTPDWPAFQHWLQTSQPRPRPQPTISSIMGHDIAEIEGATTLLIHDLKSPISVIISSLEVMLTMQEDTGATDDIMSKLLQGALQAAYRQIHLITDMIDLARLELEIYDLEPGPCDLGRIILECLNTEQYTLETKGLKLEHSLPDEALYIHADRELLTRVIHVLIDNTVKFTVRADTLRIEVGTEQNMGIMRFVDTGRPVTAGYEQAIIAYAPQWQSRQAGTRTGVGMGLPFVNAVARRLNGSFEVHSDLATGQTTFTLRLPLTT